MISYTTLRYEKAKCAHERNPDKHSLEDVYMLKKATDMEEKYLIYNTQFNREPVYLFKSRGPMLQVAIDMNEDGPKNSLQCEEACFDGSYLQCWL